MCRPSIIGNEFSLVEESTWEVKMDFRILFYKDELTKEKEFRLKKKKVANKFLIPSILLLIILSTVIVMTIFNKSDFKWDHIYGGQSKYAINDIIQSKDGNFVIIGTKNYGSSAAKIWLIKVNTEGQPLWNKLLTDEYNSTAEGSSITECPEGGFIITGEFYNESIRKWQILLFRVSEDGTVLWSKGLINDIQDERPYNIIQSSDGGFVITGSIDNDSYHRDCLVTKIDSAGNRVWNCSFGGYSTDIAYRIVEIVTDQFVVAGRTRFLPGKGNTNMYLVKLNSSGVIWEKTIGGGLYTKAFDLIKTSDGGLVLAGSSRESYEDDQQFAVVKVNREGETEWSKVYDFKGIGLCIIQSKDGNLVITGQSIDNTSLGGAVLVLKTDMNGNIIDYHHYGREEHRERVTAIIQATTEYIIIVGYGEIGGDWKPLIIESWFHKISI